MRMAPAVQVYLAINKEERAGDTILDFDLEMVAYSQGSAQPQSTVSTAECRVLLLCTATKQSRFFCEIYFW